MTLRLVYLKGSKETGLRLWNVMEPVLPQYAYDTRHKPTLGVAGLKELEAKGIKAVSIAEDLSGGK